MTIETLILLAFLQTCAVENKVDPAFAQAVATIESGARMGGIKTGPLGKKGTYAAPFGLHRAYCREKFGVDPLNPYVNIAIGVRALRGKNRRAVLKRYNKSFNEAYFKAVCQAERAYRRGNNR